MMSHDEATENLFTRDGHVTELTMDRLLLKELSPVQESAIEAHVEECDDCDEELAIARTYYGGVGEEEESAATDDEDTTAQVVDLSEERKRRRPLWVVSSVAAVACALVLFFAIPTGEMDPTPMGDQEMIGDPVVDEVRIRGDGFSMEVWISPVVDPDADPVEYGTARRADDGDALASGDRVGFRLFSVEAGDIMVVGVDPDDEVYPVYPHGEDESSARMDERPVGEDLSVAIVPDEEPGRERMVAIYCPEPFDFQTAKTAIRDEQKLDQMQSDGCSISETWLDKRAPQ